MILSTKVLNFAARPVTNTYFAIRIFDHKTILIIRISETLPKAHKKNEKDRSQTLPKK